MSSWTNRWISCLTAWNHFKATCDCSTHERRVTLAIWSWPGHCYATHACPSFIQRLPVMPNWSYVVALWCPLRYGVRPFQVTAGLSDPTKSYCFFFGNLSTGGWITNPHTACKVFWVQSSWLLITCKHDDLNNIYELRNDLIYHLKCNTVLFLKKKASTSSTVIALPIHTILGGHHYSECDLCWRLCYPDFILCLVSGYVFMMLWPSKWL